MPQIAKKVLNMFSWARRALIHPKKSLSFRGPQARAAHTLRYYAVSRYEELLNTGKLAENRRFFDKLRQRICLRAMRPFQSLF
jgi:hypothetical protein